MVMAGVTATGIGPAGVVTIILTGTGINAGAIKGCGMAKFLLYATLSPVSKVLRILAWPT
jgi:hypothetical protein